MLLFCDIIIINVLHENQRINAIWISDFLHLQKQQQQQKKKKTNNNNDNKKLISATLNSELLYWVTICGDINQISKTIVSSKASSVK